MNRTTRFHPGRKILALVLPLLMLAGGCARYQYFLVEPPQVAQPITKQGTIVPLPPLEYHLREQNRRLVVVVRNPGETPVVVSGGRSYLVDPQGESHPVSGGTIAPRSYTSFVLPPEVPVYRASPTFTLGLGFGYGHGYGYGRPWGGYGYHGGYWTPYWSGYYGPDPFWPPPAYYSPINMPGYWDWKTGTVRLNLHLDTSGAMTNAMDQTLVFDRRRQEKK